MRKRQILFDAIDVRFVHHGGGAETTTALGILAGEQMPFAGMRTQDLAGTGYFEPFGDRLLCFTATWTTHRINSFLEKERAL